MKLLKGNSKLVLLIETTSIEKYRNICQVLCDNNICFKNKVKNKRMSIVIGSLLASFSKEIEKVKHYCIYVSEEQLEEAKSKIA